jgi:imidazolonepropionase-like amidohydrolase
LAQFRELVRAKAKFVAGSDVPVMPLVPGFSLHRELELLVEMGLTPLEAIQAATRNPALAMAKSDRGTVAVDRRADLVLLSADPLARISNIRSVHTVVVGGRLLDRATLDRFLQEAEAFARAR